jgi:hypothetical protein
MIRDFRYIIGAVVIVVLIIIIASNTGYYHAVTALYHQLMRIPKLLIIILTLMAMFGFKDMVDTSALTGAFGLGGMGGRTKQPSLKKIFTPPKEQDDGKRLVSESTKKFVASKQGWKCGLCQKTLDETYEVDHITPLYKGGSNDSINLMALDPICHRKKTNADRLGMAVETFL